MTKTKETLAVVTSKNGENHKLEWEFKRTIYRDKSGRETVSYIGGRREIQRTAWGLAVLYLPARRIKAATGFNIFKNSIR